MLIYSVILSLLYVASAFGENVSSLAKSSIIIEDHIYFTDTSTYLRSHVQAVSWCRSQGAELAKVTNHKLYNELRLTFPGPATYWIDGVDKENHERFTTTNDCTPGQLNYTGFPENNLRLLARTCLALVKGSTASNSRIDATDCIIPNRVLCSYRRGGCTTTTTATTFPTVGEKASVESIPQTNLNAFTFYVLSLKRFPYGVITWTNQIHNSGARYAQTDNGGSSNYDTNGKWYFDSQWTFIPSDLNPGWYHLVNHGIPGEYAGFLNGTESEVDANKYYILLNPNYRPDYYPEIEDQFLWRPVQQPDGQFYQLKSKALPFAAVTWTEKRYLGNGRYIQIDNTGDGRYAPGGEWFDDTLFSFFRAEENGDNDSLIVTGEAMMVTL